MIFPASAQETLDKREKLLSSHLDAWEKQEKKVTGLVGDGSSFLSMGSSEMAQLASPFDDIGFLAKGPGASQDPAKAGAVGGDCSSGAALGKSSDGATAVEGQQQQRFTFSRPTFSSRRRIARLEKTISKRDHLQCDETSLALSAAIGRLEKSNATGNTFDVSTNATEISLLDSSEGRSKVMEASKNSFATPKNSAPKSRIRGNDSKSSFGVLGASRGRDGGAGARSMFSSIIRSKHHERTKSNEGAMSEEKIGTLKLENLELSKKNKILQAKLNEMGEVIELQKAMKEWRSIEELVTTYAQLWKHKSMLILASLELDRMDEKVAAYERLVESKERSICNLEAVRTKQEKWIGNLEMKCLRNGIDIAEDGVDTPPVNRGQNAPLRIDDDTTCNDGSFASFGDDEPMPFNYRPTTDRLGKSNRSDGSKSKVSETDLLGRSARSNSSRSIGLSDFSTHSDTSEQEEPTTKPSSWLTLDMTPFQQEIQVSPRAERGSKGVLLEQFLDAISYQCEKEDCLETSTWNPTKLIDFSSKSPRDIGVIPPPPPLPDRRQSDPAPASRKKATGSVAESRSSRSKSPGKRRRLKASKGENNPATNFEIPHTRSKSPGTRRRLKDGSSGSSTNLSLSMSSSSLGKVPGHRRRFKTSNSSETKLDSLSSSTRSLGRGSAHRRRLQRKESGIDRQVVSTALEKALGAALNVLDRAGDTPATIDPAEVVPELYSGFDPTGDGGLDLDYVFRD